MDEDDADALIGRIPTLNPHGETGPFNTAFTRIMTEIIELVDRRTYASKRRLAALEQRMTKMEEVSDKLGHTIRQDLPARMAQLEGGLTQSDTRFDAEIDALKNGIEASARGAAALQQEVQQVAGQLNTQAATMANYGYELAEYDAVFRRLRGGQTSL